MPGLPPIIFQNIIAGDQAYEYVIGKFVQLTALYEDFRANFPTLGGSGFGIAVNCNLGVLRQCAVVSSLPDKAALKNWTHRKGPILQTARRRGAADTRTTDCRAVTAKLSRWLRLALSGHFGTTSRSS